MLSREEIDSLFPAGLPAPKHWQSLFLPRSLPAGAQVTRFCPSPTGALHLGGIFVAMLDQAIAHQSGGTYLIRIEDTDQEREVEGAAEEFTRGLAWLDLLSDESESDGKYGPYVQSRRAEIYLTFVREFMRAGKAYPCFTTREELAALADDQRAAKVPTGYYGRWAPWRDASADLVREKLAAGDPYVVRFRSPGETGERIAYEDIIRGTITTEANRNDIVILKSSANALRLPTYHFAHAVDDHLMGVTCVIRGEEWIPSVPVHLQLFDAAGFERIPYAHIAPLMKQEGSTRRKLSKRKDPEASIEFYIAAGYPPDAIRYLLRMLANSRLSDLPVGEVLSAPLRLEECGIAGPLFDLVKLKDIASEVVVQMSSADILAAVLNWAATYDGELADVVSEHRDIAIAGLDVERVGVERPRKDLYRWADFRREYGYFFNPLFDLVEDAADARFQPVASEDVRAFANAFLENYQNHDNSDAWFSQVRAAGERARFAPTVRMYKDDPTSYVGSIREASMIARVLLTGSNRSPSLFLISQVLGEAEVRRRVGAVLAIGS